MLGSVMQMRGRDLQVRWKRRGCLPLPPLSMLLAVLRSPARRASRKILERCVLGVRHEGKA